MRKSSWSLLNSILEGFRKFPLFRVLYRVSWAPRVYHYTLAFFGALIYCFPSRKLKVIGVTGTKGKTTTLEILDAALRSAGERTALLSTVYIKVADQKEENTSGNTQRGRFFAQYFLRRAVQSGCKYALLEVTSLGVVHSRHRFVKWDAAVITNIAPEHIEAHGSFEAYRSAKLEFLIYAGKMGAKVFINKDDKNSTWFAGKLNRFKPELYSVENVSECTTDLSRWLTPEFNRENAAAAVAVARSFGIEEKIVGETLRSFEGVPGRMEFIQKGAISVVVDYAHTPDSLEAVYKTLKPNGDLICVFGSMGAEGDIGGRDKWKRPELGKIASRYCKEIVLTDEDPVEEDPMQILKDIRGGISLDPDRVREIVDRKVAIRKAVSLAKPGDTVIVTGKGSEAYIRVAGGKRIPWSDKKAVEEALAENQH